MKVVRVKIDGTMDELLITKINKVVYLIFNDGMHYGFLSSRTIRVC